MIYAWTCCLVIFAATMSPNLGIRCFLAKNIRFFRVECLYVGSTVVCHCVASSRNVSVEGAFVTVVLAAATR